MRVATFALSVVIVLLSGLAAESLQAVHEHVWKACEPQFAELGFDFCGTLDFCGDASRQQYFFNRPEEDCGNPPPAISPLIRMQNGKSYAMNVRNRVQRARADRLCSILNVHTHGLHIAGDGNADDVTREVLPGQSVLYNWTIQEDHMDGSFWYHPHHHYCAELHVQAGAVGPMILENPNIGAPDDAIQRFTENDRLLYFAEFDHGRQGADAIDGWTANGSPYIQDIDLLDGEWIRLRLAAFSANGFTEEFEFGDGCEARHVARDGVWRFQVPKAPEKKMYVTVSGRIDVAVKCDRSAPASTRTLKLNGDLVARFHVSAEQPALPIRPFREDGRSWPSLRSETVSDVSKMTGQANLWNVRVQGNKINQLEYNHYCPLGQDQDLDFSLGRLQEWTIRGVHNHPLHLHVHHMQVVTPGGCGPSMEYGEYVDTVLLHSGNSQPDDSHDEAVEDDDSNSCTVRFVPRDYAGRTVFHCHILKHEDKGSMGWVDFKGWKQPDYPRCSDLSQNCGDVPMHEEPYDCTEERRHVRGPSEHTAASTSDSSRSSAVASPPALIIGGVVLGAALTVVGAAVMRKRRQRSSVDLETAELTEIKEVAPGQ